MPWSSNKAKWRRLMLPLLLCATIPMLLAACSTRTVVIDTSCLAFAPLTWSRQDTAPTVAGIAEHNARWLRLCRQQDAGG